jgi:hypothetical protein
MYWVLDRYTHKNVQLRDVKLQDVQITKHPVYETSRLLNVQITYRPITERLVRLG